MAVLVVHGVNTREPELPQTVARYLRRYFDAVYARDFHIGYAYWGDLGGRFRFDGLSRPRTRFLNQGPTEESEAVLTDEQFADVLARFPEGASTGSSGSTTAGRSGGFVSGGPTASLSNEARLADLERRVAIEYLSRCAEATSLEGEGLADVLIEIEELRDDEAFWTRVRNAESLAAELASVNARLELPAGSRFVTQGFGEFTDRVAEGLTRFRRSPARAASAVLGELRPKLDGLLEQFIGDVFTYLKEREPDPPVDASGARTIDELIDAIAGPIPARVIRELLAVDDARRAGEPLMVLTHSMGGQIIYDIATTFLPRLASAAVTNGIAFDPPVMDLWCATASQVGLFEELGLFIAEAPNARAKTPFPGDHVRAWWNVWDHSDLISYTAEPVFEGVDDAYFNTGNSFAGAHGAYLERPSFFKELAEKLASTQED